MADGAAGYRNRKYQSSFAGYFPAENPKYSMIVVVRNPRNGYYGASVAGPVFRELADMIYANDLEINQRFDQLHHLGMTQDLPAAKGSTYATQNVLSSLGLNNKYASANTSTPSLDDAFTDTLPIKEGVVPQLHGMGLIDAVFALENAGFKSSVIGKGKVIAQSIPAGTISKPGSLVQLVLK